LVEIDRRKIEVKETQARAKLVKALRETLPEGTVVLRHEDIRTAGIPDISVSFGDRTVWIEVKAEPFKLKGIQHETLRRLHGVYVIAEKAGWVIAVPRMGGGFLYQSSTPLNLAEVVRRIENRLWM